MAAPAEALTLPFSWYTDDELLRREQQFQSAVELTNQIRTDIERSRKAETRLLAAREIQPIPGIAQSAGVLCVHWNELRSISANDVSFLQSMANLIGLVFQRDRIETELATETPNG